MRYLRRYTEDGTSFTLLLESPNGRRKDDYLRQESGITSKVKEECDISITVSKSGRLGAYTLTVWTPNEQTDLTGYTSFSDSIEFTEQQNDYFFTPSVDGAHSFGFADVPDGVKFELEVYNSAWESIKRKDSLENGSFVTCGLKADKTYCIRVKQYYRTGGYTLKIGAKKEISDITGYTAVKDSVEYGGQRNTYQFTASENGFYRFELDDLPDGVYVDLNRFNTAMEYIKSADGSSNGAGMTVELDAGQTIFVQVEQKSRTGAYTLKVGYQKPVGEISVDRGVSDSVQYTEQRNCYIFTPPSDGNYKFRTTNIPDGVGVKLVIRNMANEYQHGTDYMKEGSEYEVELKGGKQVLVCIVQNVRFGNYYLTVGK